MRRFILSLSLIILAGCGGNQVITPYPGVDDLWTDAESFVRGVEVEDRIGKVENLQRSYVKLDDRGTERAYVFLVEAVKGSGKVTVEYEYTKRGWVYDEWEYEMGFPPPEKTD